jgi:hypothetical protein
VNDDDVDRLFADLFEGQPQAYGLVHGECVKAPVTRKVWDEHLVGDTPIGVYPMRRFHPHERKAWAQAHGVDGGDFYVKWGCTDLDNKDDPDSLWPLARNMHKALRALGIIAWIERTKGKGYHVWVFADEWVPAIVMRRALLAAHQVAGVAATEVNPKQVEPGAKGFGNYVNLPYPYGAVDRRVVLGAGCGSFFAPDEVITLDHFLDEARRSRASFETLRNAALLYKEPPKRTVGAYTEPNVEATEIAKRLKGLAYTIWFKGVLEGRDRSGTLVRLAHLMAEQGNLTPGEALVVLRDADARWGKYFERADCDEQLRGMIDRAFSKHR